MASVACARDVERASDTKRFPIRPPTQHPPPPPPPPRQAGMSLVVSHQKTDETLLTPMPPTPPDTRTPPPNTSRHPENPTPDSRLPFPASQKPKPRNLLTPIPPRPPDPLTRPRLLFPGSCYPFTSRGRRTPPHAVSAAAATTVVGDLGGRPYMRRSKTSDLLALALIAPLRRLSLFPLRRKGCRMIS